MVELETTGNVLLLIKARNIDCHIDTDCIVAVLNVE
jgi:hypothetical protein